MEHVKGIMPNDITWAIPADLGQLFYQKVAEIQNRIKHRFKQSAYFREYPSIPTFFDKFYFWAMVQKISI